MAPVTGSNFTFVEVTSVVLLCLVIHFMLETENNNHSQMFDQW